MANRIVPSPTDGIDNGERREEQPFEGDFRSDAFEGDYRSDTKAEREEQRKQDLADTSHDALRRSLRLIGYVAPWLCLAVTLVVLWHIFGYPKLRWIPPDELERMWNFVTSSPISGAIGLFILQQASAFLDRFRNSTR